MPSPSPPPPQIEPRGQEPPYRQIAAWLRERITSGDLQEPGSVLPSEKELELTFGVARTTVRRAIAVLRDEDGLIFTVAQRGSYVAKR